MTLGADLQKPKLVGGGQKELGGQRVFFKSLVLFLYNNSGKKEGLLSYSRQFCFVLCAKQALVDLGAKPHGSPTCASASSSLLHMLLSCFSSNMTANDRKTNSRMYEYVSCSVLLPIPPQLPFQTNTPEKRQKKKESGLSAFTERPNLTKKKVWVCFHMDGIISILLSENWPLCSKITHHRRGKNPGFAPTRSVLCLQG